MQSLTRSHSDRRCAIFTLAILLAMIVCGVTHACPTCKDSIAETDANHAGMVRGYFWSILFMMSMPFLILAGLSTYMYLEVRKARLHRASANRPARAVAERYEMAEV